MEEVRKEGRKEEMNKGFEGSKKGRTEGRKDVEERRKDVKEVKKEGGTGGRMWR